MGFNRGQFPTVADFDWVVLRLPGGRGGRWEVRDLWARTSMGTFAGGFQATVQPHDVVMVVLKPAAS